MFDGVSVASRLAKAVAFAEGCIDIHENYHKLSLPYRLNNPCDLKVTNSYFTSHMSPSGKLQFVDIGTGWNAGAFQMELMLTNKSHVYNNNMTIQEVANHYAKEHETPLEQQNADHWAKNVALFLGVETTTVLSQLFKETPSTNETVPEVSTEVVEQPKSSFASRIKKGA